MKCSTFSLATAHFKSEQCHADATHIVKGKSPEGNEYSDPACGRHSRYLLMYHPDMYQTSEPIGETQ